MRKLQPLEDDCSKLKEGFSKVLRNHPFVCGMISQPFCTVLWISLEVSCHYGSQTPQDEANFAAVRNQPFAANHSCNSLARKYPRKGVPAEHESAETPIRHESNDAVARDRTLNQMVSLPLPLLGTNQLLLVLVYVEDIIVTGAILLSIAVNKVCQFMHHPYEQTEARQKMSTGLPALMTGIAPVATASFLAPI
ncbi:hypothetical protein CK203_017317 [Vitis vinifera]|uniref:Uncharacterized protein n=1 Tax=Vitis vinifera TaxID=29760 RepID=A0A438JZV1_VITVI|nr:hypothetical protein CK203_017317 [Vitis vinifera]